MKGIPGKWEIFEARRPRSPEGEAGAADEAVHPPGLDM
jgi:hypothetical protein